jgi:hypothetical protein
VVANPGASFEHWTQAMEARMDAQRQALRARDPAWIAAQSGAAWEPEANRLALAFLRQRLVVRVPDYVVTIPDGDPIPTISQALVLAYLVVADGTPRAGEWIAFRELPDGLFYHAAFSGYSGQLLVRGLGEDLEAFTHGARACGGTRLTGFGDAAFEFLVLPHLWLAVVYWRGDDEDGFPPQANVLFDRAAGRMLITDGLAILGGQLARRILKAARAG